MTKREISVTVFNQEQYDGTWPPGNLAEHIRWLNDRLESIPAEHQHTATIEISSVGSYEDSHYASIVIEWRRLETDEEEADREAATAAYQQQRRDAELQTLAALQAKYGVRP